MTPKESDQYEATLAYFLDAVESEGLWYAVDTYSMFGRIKDERFHKLRRAFKAAGNALMKYAEEKCPGWEP